MLSFCLCWSSPLGLNCIASIQSLGTGGLWTVLVLNIIYCSTAEMSKPTRESLLFLAKLAEQSERYEGTSIHPFDGGLPV